MPEIDYKPLGSVVVGRGARVRSPDLSLPRPVRLDSPAIEVMTDLRLVAAATVTEDAALDFANHAMIARGVRSLLVIDTSGAVVGLITARDILGERPLQAVHEQGLRHEELAVRHVMTPRDRLEAIDITEVLQAKVGHVLATLRAAGRQHALVVEQVPGRGLLLVRGVFSVSQLARQLGVPVHQTEVARTFADIEAAIGA